MQQIFRRLDGEDDLTALGLKARNSLVEKVPYVDSKESYKDPRI